MDPTAPHYVYRLFDAAGQLLYIGATANVEARLSRLLQPSNGYKVPGLVADRVARRTVVRYANRAVAFAAEREAIKTEMPLLNRQSATGTHCRSGLHETTPANRGMNKATGYGFCVPCKAISEAKRQIRRPSHR